MHWIEIKVTLSSADEALAVDLICDAFYNLGAKGVVIDDPYLEPVEQWGADAVPLPTQPAVTGYLPADEHLEQRRLDLEKALAALAAAHTFQHTIIYQRIDEEDWAEAWKAFFWPEKITSHLVVKPTWREYVPEPGQQVIEIDPGMAFGTGTHPTTALCIQLLEKHIRTGQDVLDVGTGSGILLIAAAKLGAGRLIGVDQDPLAIEIARNNMRLNHIAPNRFELHSGDLIDPVNESFDMVVANILADVILDLLDGVNRVMKPDSIFICSGIIEAYQDKVIQKMAACGLELIDTRKQGDWVALAGRS